MKRFLKILLIIFIILVLLTNATQLFSTWQWYHFTTRDGKFQFDMYEAKGRDFGMMDRWWEDYKENKHPTDTIIYRTFAKNPLKFWEWRQYLFNKKYRYPYLSSY